MKKIPTVFQRDVHHPGGAAGRYVTTRVTQGCEWVLDGEGVATRKYDGTCFMFDGTDWWARREVKPGKLVPPGFVQVHLDQITGKVTGWLPAAQSDYREYFEQARATLESHIDVIATGTYELVGPKVNNNPEKTVGHHLLAHADAEVIPDLARTYGALRGYVVGAFEACGWEGIVFHHPDGRMAKLKARDFKRDT